ncbi:MAG TPA: hypothetical protein VHJ20_21410 [Polyangia bacterium]|nr:hypothetical protein [Polyangia bacterium]
MTTLRSGALVAVGCVFIACGSVSPIGTGAGGDGGGGSTGSGGSTSTGGTTGTGGSTSTGGVTGTGGATGVGGMSGRVPVKHRAEGAMCEKTRAAGNCAAVMSGTTGGVYQCKTDADCTMGDNGRCLPTARILGCSCSYDGCFSDSDCKATTGGACACRTAGAATPNVCQAGNCRTDGDCGAGGFCSPTLGSCGNYGGVVGNYCHTAHDECVDDSDCAAQVKGDCRWTPETSTWTCQSSQCAG